MTDETSPDDELTVSEVAELLGQPVKTVRDLLYEGRLVGRKAGAAWRVPRREVERYADHGRASASPNPMFVEGDEYRQKIEAAQQAVDDLIEQRNRAMLQWRERGAVIDAIATAFNLGRQRTSDLLRITRAETRAEQALKARP